MARVIMVPGDGFFLETGEETIMIPGDSFLAEDQPAADTVIPHAGRGGRCPPYRQDSWYYV